MKIIFKGLWGLTLFYMLYRVYDLLMHYENCNSYNLGVHFFLFLSVIIAIYNVIKYILSFKDK